VNFGTRLTITVDFKPLHLRISLSAKCFPPSTTGKASRTALTYNLGNTNRQRVEQKHTRALGPKRCFSRPSHDTAIDYISYLHNRLSKRLEVVVVVIVRAQRPHWLWSHGGDGADRLYVADRLDPSVLLLLLARRPRRGGRRRRRQTMRFRLGQEGGRLRSRRRQRALGGGRLVVVVQLVLLPLQLLLHTQPQRPAQGALQSWTIFFKLFTVSQKSSHQLFL
jgi:hypothetical protein